LSKSVEKGAVEVSFRPLKASKSLEQLAYYNGVVLPIIVSAMKDNGNNFTKTKVHLFLKDKYARIDFFNELTQEFKDYIPSCADLTMKQMSTFIAEVILFASEIWGLEIPSAESYREMGE
jgi:hypothetical protein